MNIPVKKTLSFSPRRDYLTRKVHVIRTKIQKEVDPIELEKLYAKLHDVKEEINQINLDPLTYEYCKAEPWIDECKIHDN